MTRETFLAQLLRYETRYEEEQAFVPLFIDILSFENCYNRDLLDRHLTASAWVLHPDRTHVLLLHHTKLGRWLQPGGHADGQEDLLHVALKEVEEETNLRELELIGNSWFDLDIHTIPARKDVPAHDHYDVRFMFIAHDFIRIDRNHESTALQWVALSQVSDLTGGEASMLRMLAKTER